MRDIRAGLAILLSVLTIVVAASPGNTRPTARLSDGPTDDELRSAAWWVQQAMIAAAVIDRDTDDYGPHQVELADLQVRVGDHAGFAETVKRFGKWSATLRTPDRFRAAAYAYMSLCRPYARLGNLQAVRACTAWAEQCEKKSGKRPLGWGVAFSAIREIAAGGMFDEAERLAMSTTRPAQRRSALDGIIPKLTEAGRRDDARRLLSLAEAAAREARADKSEDTPYDELKSFAWQLAAADEFHWAEKIISELPVDGRPDLLQYMAASCFKRNDRAGFRRYSDATYEALRSVKREGLLVETVASLAGLQQAAGDKAAADRTLALAGATKDNADFHFRQALLAARARDLQSMNQSLDAAVAAERAEATRAVGEMLPDMRAFALAPYPRLAQALIDVGEIKAARQLLERVDPKSGHAAGVNVVLMTLDAREGRIADAIRFVDAQEEGFSRLLYVGRLVGEVAKHGSLESRRTVYAWIRTMQDPVRRAHACSVFAVTLIEAQETPTTRPSTAPARR